MDSIEELLPATEQAKSLPTSPGVYLMKDAQGTIIYIGKAANLHNRVQSYFGSPSRLSVKTQQLVSKVSQIEYLVTSSEQEALLVESNLIKRHRPYYNIRLKDDKNFPYLKINPTDPWPRLETTRRVASDGAYYFGPFASSQSLRQMLKAINSIFPLRRCSRDISKVRHHPCLYFHIGKCLGPCTGQISHEDYMTITRQLIWFMEGKYAKVIHELEAKMKRLAASQEYEKAAQLRDQLIAIDRILSGQQLANRVRGDQDVIALYHDGNLDYVQVFFIRGGRLTGRDSFVLEGTSAESPTAVITSFVKQFYLLAPYIPPLIIVQYPVNDTRIIRDWLSQKRGGAVVLVNPRRGSKLQLVEMVATNAKEAAEQARLRAMAMSSTLAQAMLEIRDALHIDRMPVRMEAYDISDIQGTAAVGSMVVFESGRPKPAQYKRFRIKTVPGANDYASLQEVIKRRFTYSKREAKNDAWKAMPDLIVIDGGKGQLRAVIDAMHGVDIDPIPVISLAKEREEIFLPGQNEPIILSPSSAGLQLLQRLRDEAHRFALGYHHSRRRKEAFASILNDVPSIGMVRQRKLLQRFGSVQAIASASSEEITQASGVSIKTAQQVKQCLKSI